MKKLVIFILILPALLFMWRGCYSPVIVSEPFEAWVVEEESGKPLEGAIVVAEWSLYEATGHGHRLREMVDVQETVTDQNGRFAFPGFTIQNWKLYELQNGPKVTIFKPGYKYQVRRTHCGSSGGDCPWARRISPVAGKQVKLKKLEYEKAQKTDETRNSYHRTLYGGLSTEMDDVLSSCNSKKIAQLLTKADEEAERLSRMGFVGRNSLPSVAQLDRYKHICGFGKEVLEIDRK